MRLSRAGTGLLLLFASFFVFTCGPAPSVVQGTVVRYDTVAKVVIVRDELAPHATLELSIGGAEVGADPVPGDTVRVAYYVAGNRLTATRVMNVTSQDELGKRGGASSGGH